ncbi:MAG: 1-acyl-sn-glycerol-3-phosphate acyltransferase [Gemmatales bacterium]|nr:MAG: 1-acyl-sn-glycerol-3-phosphate acyltransferase [Gemmatales bacterium]
MWAIVMLSLALTVLLARYKSSGERFFDFLGMRLLYLFARLWHRLSWQGAERVPVSGPVLVVSNHTCSADPLFLVASSFRPYSFLIAAEFFRLPLARHLFRYLRCVPVNRRDCDVLSVRRALRLLAEGRGVCIFPEAGLRNAGRKVVRNGKAGAALIALRSRACVIPAAVVGGPQTPHLLEAWLGPSRAHVTFGSPLDLAPYYGQPVRRPLLERVNRYIMDAIMQLENQGR